MWTHFKIVRIAVLECFVYDLLVRMFSVSATEIRQRCQLCTQCTNWKNHFVCRSLRVENRKRKINSEPKSRSHLGRYSESFCLWWFSVVLSPAVEITINLVDNSNNELTFQFGSAWCADHFRFSFWNASKATWISSPRDKFGIGLNPVVRIFLRIFIIVSAVWTGLLWSGSIVTVWVSQNTLSWKKFAIDCKCMCYINYRHRMWVSVMTKIKLKSPHPLNLSTSKFSYFHSNFNFNLKFEKN